MLAHDFARGGARHALNRDDALRDMIGLEIVLKKALDKILTLEKEAYEKAYNKKLIYDFDISDIVLYSII